MREIRTLSAAANSLFAEMLAASHRETSSQQILPKLIVVVSNFRASFFEAGKTPSPNFKAARPQRCFIGFTLARRPDVWG